MARDQRTGNRKTREQRNKVRVPELGYYLIVTDTEATERCYFNGLHESLPYEIQDKLIIRVVETKTRNMLEKCMELTAYEAQYRMPALRESWTCCSEFGKVYESRTGQKYSKADSNIYRRICKNGNEEKAIRIAQQKFEQCKREGKVKPSEMWPCTTVHELVGEIKRKINKV